MTFIPNNDALQHLFNQQISQAGTAFSGPLAAATAINEQKQKAALQMLQLLSQSDPRLISTMLQENPNAISSLMQPAGPLAPKMGAPMGGGVPQPAAPLPNAGLLPPSPAPAGAPSMATPAPAASMPGPMAAPMAGGGGSILDNIVSTASRLANHPRSPLAGMPPDKIAAFMKSTIDSVGGLGAVMASSNPPAFMQAAMDYFSNPAGPQAPQAAQTLLKLMPSQDAIYAASEKGIEEGAKHKNEMEKQRLIGQQALDQLAKKAEYDKILEQMKEAAAKAKENLKPLPEQTVKAWVGLSQLSDAIVRLKSDWQQYAKEHGATARLGTNLLSKLERYATGGEQDITSYAAPGAEPVIADIQKVRGLIDQIILGGGRIPQQIYNRLAVIVPGLGENYESGSKKFDKLIAFANKAADMRKGMQKEAAALGYDISGLDKLQSVMQEEDATPTEIYIPNLGLVRMETGKPPVLVTPAAAQPQLSKPKTP